MSEPLPAPEQAAHPGWVRSCHWIVALSFLVLTFTGFVILQCHPRLYWGEVGNELMPALVEFPISKNYRHGEWIWNGPFTSAPGSPISATRTFEIYDENDWARSLHFLGAWLLVVPGAIYLAAGFATGHFRRHFRPRADELTATHIRQEVIDHMRMRVPRATGGPQYGLLQKLTYCCVVFFVTPLAVVTGLAMSPAITAAYPVLGTIFGGFQSARTIHFGAAVILVLFLIVHVVMVVRSGFWRQMRGMTLGRRS